jgi:hypothetical protein
LPRLPFILLIFNYAYYSRIYAITCENGHGGGSATIVAAHCMMVTDEQRGRKASVK